MFPPTLQEAYGYSEVPEGVVASGHSSGNARAKRRTYRVLQLYPGGFCSYCGRRRRRLTIDHVESRSERKRNRDSMDNLVPACEPCNHAKGDMTLLMFLRLGNYAHGKNRRSDAHSSLVVQQYESTRSYPLPREASWYRRLSPAPVADGGDRPA